MSKSKPLKVIQETSTGKNTVFKNTQTDVNHSLPTVIKKIESGELEKYHIVRPKNGEPYPRSNPDKSGNNNIETK